MLSSESKCCGHPYCIIIRVPTGSMAEKNPCMEKSWNLKNDEIWTNLGIFLEMPVWMSWALCFSSFALLARQVLINFLIFNRTI